MRHTAFCLQRVSHSHQESEWNTHKHTFLSNNMALIAVHFRNLVRLHSHQQQTVLEFTWTVPQNTLFKRTRVRFTGANPRSDDSVHIIQTNRTLTSIEPGCAPKVLVWKHPKSQLSFVYRGYRGNSSALQFISAICCQTVDLQIHSVCLPYFCSDKCENQTTFLL